jgi:hypothetical protein
MMNQNLVAEIATSSLSDWWKALCHILPNIPFIIMNLVIQIEISGISSYHDHKNSIDCHRQFETDQIYKWSLTLWIFDKWYFQSRIETLCLIANLGIWHMHSFIKRMMRNDESKSSRRHCDTSKKSMMKSSLSHSSQHSSHHHQFRYSDQNYSYLELSWSQKFDWLSSSIRDRPNIKVRSTLLNFSSIVHPYVKPPCGTSSAYHASPCYFLMMRSDTSILLLRTDITASTDCPNKLSQSDRKQEICRYLGQYSLSSPRIGPVMII